MQPSLPMTTVMVTAVTTSPSADMVRLYVNVQFQVKPLSTGISSSRTKKNSSKNACIDHTRYVPSLESLAQV